MKLDLQRLVFFVATMVTSLSFAKQIQILNMDLSRDEVVITNDESRKLEDGDKICFYRGTVEIGCGQVIAVTPFDATVKLLTSSSDIHTARTEKNSPTESYVELVFERIEIQKSDRAEFKGAAEKTQADLTNQTLLEGLVQLRRSVASQRDNLYGKEDLIIETEKKILDYDSNLDHRLMSNIAVGVNYIFPMVSYQQRITDNLILSVSPTLVNTPAGNGNVGGFGTYVTLNHYGIEAFHGDWIQLGAGFMKLTSGDAHWNSPAILTTAGWRWFFDGGVNFGLGLGLQYFLNRKPATAASVDFSGLLPSVIMDLGFAF